MTLSTYVCKVTTASYSSPLGLEFNRAVKGQFRDSGPAKHKSIVKWTIKTGDKHAKNLTVIVEIELAT